MPFVYPFWDGSRSGEAPSTLRTPGARTERSKHAKRIHHEHVGDRRVRDHAVVDDFEARGLASIT